MWRGAICSMRRSRGAYEIIEFLMCLMILSALPLVSLQGRHVEASLVADLVPRAATLLHWLAGLMAAGLFALLAMLMWNYAGQLARQNAQSLFGAIPHAPFATFMAVLFWRRRHRSPHRHGDPRAG